MSANSKRTKRSADRDEKGKFLPGHGIKSPGNPNLVHVAELRQAVREVITSTNLKAVISKLFLLAMSGDTRAAQLVLNYALGRPREMPDAVKVELPKIESAGDLVRAAAAIAEAAGRGEISPQDARALSELVAVTGKAFELTELEHRLRVLERRDVEPDQKYL